MAKTAVVLCGGRGTRLGSVGEAMPKALLPVRGYPILWYIINGLMRHGVKRFIFPLGYKGEMIADYLKALQVDESIVFEPVDTGIDSSISSRLIQVLPRIPDDDSFLLTNGDTLFDFGIYKIWDRHVKQNAGITFITCKTISQYGLVTINDGNVTGFARNSVVSGYEVEESSNTTAGLVYSGISIISKSVFSQFSLDPELDFESQLFPQLISHNLAQFTQLEGFWCAIDTQKDLSIIDSCDYSDSRVRGADELRDRLLRASEVEPN